MTDLDLHLVEVFERKRRGEASAADARMLEEHALVCRACAVHLAVLRDTSPRSKLSSDDRMRDERAIAFATSRFRVGRRRPMWGVWAVAAASILVAGVSGAALWERFGSSFLGRQTLPLPDRAPVAANGGAPPANVEESARAVDPTPAEGADLGPAVERSRHRNNANNPVAPSAEAPAELFAEANELRRKGNDVQAIQTYRTLQRLFPASPEAQQSHSTLGWMLLDRSTPQEALAQFDRYLERKGPAIEDALAGRALALQRLGHVADERRTLESLVQRFPDSVNAARAKARLSEIR